MYIKVYQGMSRYIKVCQGISRYIKIYKGMSGYIKVYQGISRQGQTCTLITMDKTLYINHFTSQILFYFLIRFVSQANVTSLQHPPETNPHNINCSRAKYVCRCFNSNNNISLRNGMFYLSCCAFV